MNLYNFKSIYKYAFEPDPKKYITNKNPICFRQVFNEPESFLHIKITFFKVDLNKVNLEKLKYSPCCILPKELIKAHIESCMKIQDFSYKLKYIGTLSRGVKEVELTLNIPKCRKLVRNYILTWIKYLFEYPMSFWMYDVWRLKKEEYPTFDVENICLLVSNCYSYWNSNHTVMRYKNGPALTTEHLIRRLNYVKYLNEVYWRDLEIKPGSVILNSANYDNLITEYPRRLSVYKHNNKLNKILTDKLQLQINEKEKSLCRRRRNWLCQFFERLSARR